MLPAASSVRIGAADRILRPAERRRAEALLELGALGAAWADRREHLLADRVGGWLAVVADGVERVGRAIAGLRDDLAPVGVVARIRTSGTGG